MLFNKYQYSDSDIRKRGYSQNCIARDENKGYWVKWILGIDKLDTKTKILADRLRHLQKARHNSLPDIVEYGFDEEQKAFAVVYELLQDVETLEQKATNLNNQNAISGFIDLADCLQELHSKYKIHHGDIQPANILIDKNGQFYLVDFGLADLTKTLSQSQELEIFARAFAAPEKLNKIITKGFPYQSDIYSLGKVVEWFYDEKQQNIEEDYNIKFQKLLADAPADRPSWQQVIDILKQLATVSATQSIQIDFRSGFITGVAEELNSGNPIFDIAPKDGNNYLMDIIINKCLFEGVIWLKSENRLLFNGVKNIDTIDKQYLERKIREGRKLPLKYLYTDEYSDNKADLTPYFQKWFELKKKQVSLRENRKAVREELGFYRELLEKEKEVIAKNSLRIEYNSFEVKGNEVYFRIKPHEKNSTIGFILRHIEEGNDVNSEGFEYVVSASSDRRQNKEIVEFAGIPYDFQEGILKIKDCERIRKENIPRSGYLFENTNKKEEEKNRQLDAIRKVDKNEVQNPDLIYFLFKPEELKATYREYTGLEKVWQRNKDNKPLEYSYNQQKAILNALHKEPLSVIQGPPGTGKTTVITEIVFQILAQKPDAKILITSQTNNAVDQVLENLLKNEIPILRLSGITAPKVQSIKKHTLERKLEGWKQQVRSVADKNFQKIRKEFFDNMKDKSLFAPNIIEILLENNDWQKVKLKIESYTQRVQNLKTLHTLPDEKEIAIALIDKTLGIGLTSFYSLWSLHKDWIITINSLDEKSAINQKLIDSIRVIGATCNHIASRKYSKYNFEFDYVIMDESGKATTAEALVPIILGKNLIFVGDHRQLRPMLTSTREVERWLREKFKKDADELESWDDYFNKPSLFERVITSIDFDYKAQLTECRRSSLEQINLTSKCFYEPEGDEAIEPIKREVAQEHNLPLAIETSILFIDIGSHYKSETDGEKNKSSLNKVSAELIPEILNQLNKYEKVKEYSFGVITGYSAQYIQIKKWLNKKIQHTGLKNIRNWNKQEEKLTVSVVDRFQGLERDIVIVDLVKSGAGLNLGFLEVPNRINVALSRQKKLLIIVGDYYGIINATTKRNKGEKAALQHYLESIKPNWIVKSEQINEVFK